ncbi:hypothetical protein ACLOJK_027052 [Asimina triloba]
MEELTEEIAVLKKALENVNRNGKTMAPKWKNMLEDDKLFNFMAGLSHGHRQSLNVRVDVNSGEMVSLIVEKWWEQCSVMAIALDDSNEWTLAEWTLVVNLQSEYMRAAPATALAPATATATSPPPTPDMARDGHIVPADPQAAALKKKTAVLRSWILLDCTGECSVLDLDKYAIMHRVQIHARDLRILDPLLSYPSTILGRERAIVLNLEHIKAIITSEEVFLRDPTDENVIPIVEELRRRLPPENAMLQQNDAEAAEEDESPFEFRALEVALEAICSFLDARTTELETAAYPALDELTSKLSLMSHFFTFEEEKT